MTTLHAKGLLFDCDGVLVDSTESVEAHWVAFAGWHDIDADSLLERCHGKPHLATIRQELAGRPESEIVATIERFEKLEVEDASHDKAMPGAADLLALLPDRNWAIVTSCWRELADARTKAAGIALPDVVVTADQLEHGKPSPDGYLKAAQLLGLDPLDCIVFEDSASGVSAGLEAGCRVVALRTTTPEDKLPRATAIVDDLSCVEVTGKFTIDFAE